MLRSGRASSAASSPARDLDRAQRAFHSVRIFFFQDSRLNPDLNAFLPPEKDGVRIVGVLAHQDIGTFFLLVSDAVAKITDHLHIQRLLARFDLVYPDFGLHEAQQVQVELIRVLRIKQMDLTVLRQCIHALKSRLMNIFIVNKVKYFFTHRSSNLFHDDVILPCRP